MGKKGIFVFIFFVVILFMMTFPLLLKVTSCIPGFFSTDESYAALWDAWRIKYSLQNALPLRHTPLIVHPFGLDLYSAGYFSYLWMAFFYLLSLATNYILAFNIQVILNLILSALFTYMLVFYLTRDRLCAVFSGVTFAFCPYQLVRAWQHLGLTYNQWIPLLLFSAIRLKDDYSKKNIFIFLASFLLVFSFDWSVMYMSMIALLAYLVFVFIRGLKYPQSAEPEYLGKTILLMLGGFILLLPQYLPIIKNMLGARPVAQASAFNLYHRPFEDLFAQSAKLLSYFLPAVAHPVFGRFTENFLGTKLYGDSFTEHTLYLGWVPLILAFYAFLALRCNASHQSPVTSHQFKERYYISFFIFLAIAAWLFSQPPWWQVGPLKIYMPSFFMYKILPMFRAYCRFGIVLMLAVSVLAGFGLKVLLSKYPGFRSKLVIISLAVGVVLFEFWSWPPYRVIDVSLFPQAYHWLGFKPKDTVIAEYPLDAGSPNEMYKFYQIAHAKRIINGSIPGTTPHEFAQKLVKLSSSNTAGILSWMKVKYVFVHKDDYLKTELAEDMEELKSIPGNPGLKLSRSFPAQSCPDKNIACIVEAGAIDVYEVIAKPINPDTEKR